MMANRWAIRRRGREFRRRRTAAGSVWIKEVRAEEARREEAEHRIDAGERVFHPVHAIMLLAYAYLFPSPMFGW